MKTLLLSLALAGAAAWAWHATAAKAPESGSDAFLLQVAADPASLHRVTAQPVAMTPQMATLCREVSRPGHARLVPLPATYQVYVTAPGEPAMKQKDAAFPPGTVILKQKFTTSKDTPALYTGMFKHEPGYKGGCGDWEFFTLSGDAKTVTSRGQIESCMRCHRNYASSDFVTKDYQ